MLLVDPDRRVRSALRTLLNAAGFVVSAEAADLPAARSAADRCRPRFAVVDPQLPTAAAGCRLIDELHREGGVVVIALTSDPRLREPARAAGAERVLIKDCAPEELLRALTDGRSTDGRWPDRFCRASMEESALQIETQTESRAPDGHPRVTDPERPPLLPARVEAVATAHPDRLCLVEGDGPEHTRMSFAQTCRAVEETAARLRHCGVGPADKVAVLSPNDPRVIVTTLSLLAVGAAWLPINSRESTATIVALLEGFDCDALIVHPDLAAVADGVAQAVPGLRGVMSLDDVTTSAGEASRLKPRGRDIPAEDSDLGAVFPTGGTTGRPKGVMFTHERLAALAECYASVQARPDDVYLAAAPLTHVGGRICLSVIASGGTVVVLPGFDERAVFDAIDRHRVTTLTVTSTMLYRLLDCPDRSAFDLSSLRSLVYGGGPTAVSRIRQAIEVFGPVLEGGFGQTEAPMFITRLRPEDHLVDGKPAPDERLRSVGRPTGVSEVHIVDGEGEEVPRGSAGRVLVRGPFVMNGYYRDPEATSARCVGTFHNTGDIGFLDRDGFLTLVGRESDLIITGGFNVYPAEVENVVAALPGVRECAVFGLPDDRWGEVVTAVVSPIDGAQLDPDELRGSARPLLGGVKTPKRIEIVDELPRNDAGKILKRVLRDALLGDASARRRSDEESSPCSNTS